MWIFDSQVHAYERNHPGRPWVGTLHGPAEVTGDQMVAAMDASLQLRGLAAENALKTTAIARGHPPSRRS